MAVIANKTTHNMRFEAYDANKQRMTQNAPVIPPQYARYVNQGHIGSSDFFYLLAFYDTDEFRAPPGIGIISGTEGAGVSIAGAGGFSVTVTVSFAQPVAAVKVSRHAGWTLQEEGGPTGDMVFSPGQDLPNDKLMGW